MRDLKKKLYTLLEHGYETSSSYVLVLPNYPVGPGCLPENGQKWAFSQKWYFGEVVKLDPEWDGRPNDKFWIAGK